MKIKEIEIENYRGFRDKKSIILKNDINVIVGVNGAGKTSILDLIASFLNTFTVKFSGSSNRELEQNLTMLDINIDEQETCNKIYVNSEIVHNLDFGNFSRIDTISWELKRDFKGGKSNFKQLNEYIAAYQKLFKVNPEQSIPIFKYFQSQRNSAERLKQIISNKRYIAEQFKAYDTAFDKILEFDEFIAWFVEEENKENRAKVSLGNLSYTNPRLNAVRKAVIQFLESFPSFEYKNLRVEERTFNLKTNEKSSLVIDKNNKTFNLKQLSDGERVLILLVSDIAHRLALANPELANCLLGTGIILIDEIDLHLHPAWQREVIPCLLKTFPNLQFITTTHSPQLLSNINPENIYIIEDFNFIEFAPNTFGNDSNTILWDIFGVSERPEHTKAKLEKLYEIIDEADKQNEAKKLLNELSLQLGENNSEILRAKLHFEFQNNIG